MSEAEALPVPVECDVLLLVWPCADAPLGYAEWGGDWNRSFVGADPEQWEAFCTALELLDAWFDGQGRQFDDQGRLALPDAWVIVGHSPAAHYAAQRAASLAAAGQAVH